MTPIAELFALIKVKGDKQVVSSMNNIVKSTMGAKVALGAAVTALYQMSKAARDMAVNLDMYQLNTSLSTEQLQKLSYQASQAGVSMTELGGTIQHLQNLSAKANLGEGWSPVLSRFGIIPGEDPVNQLNKIGDALRRMQSYAPAEARQLASEVGISDTMYYALLKGGTDEMNKQFILTEKEQKSLVKLNQQWNRFWFYIKQINVKIQALGSALQTKFVKILTNAVQGFGELFTRVVSFIDAHKELQAIIVGIILALNPWLAILSGIALILEDIFVYFEGGDSVTGKIVGWIQQTEAFRNTWEGVIDVFKIFLEVIKMAFSGLKTLFSVLDDAGAFKKVLEGIMSALNGIVKIIMGLTQLPFVKKAFERAGFGKINEIAEGYFNREAGVGDYARPNISNRTSGDVNVTTTVNMNGTANTREDGRTIADTISDQVEEATRQNSYLPQSGGGLKYEPVVG